MWTTSRSRTIAGTLPARVRLREERSSHVQHVSFEYKYDAHGNWTDRIVSVRVEPNSAEQPSNIERRIVDYHLAQTS